MSAQLALERGLQGVTINVVGREKVPFAAELLDQRIGDRIGLHARRLADPEHVPAAAAAGDLVDMTAGHDMKLALFRGHLRHRERHRRVDVAGDEIDLVAVDQLAGLVHAGGNVVGRIGDQQLDLTAEDAAALVDPFDGEAGAGDLGLGERRINPGERLHHPDLYRRLRPGADRERRGHGAGSPRQPRLEQGAARD